MGRPPKNTEPQAQAPDMAQFRADAVKTVKCITELQPWTVPVGEEEARPLRLGEVVRVPLEHAKNLVRKGFVTLWDEDMED